MASHPHIATRKLLSHIASHALVFCNPIVFIKCHKWGKNGFLIWISGGKIFSFHFYSKKTSNIISKFSDNFSEDFFEVFTTHFSRSKNKDFRNSSWFSDIFSKNAKSFLKSSNFELQKCYIPQNNSQKNHYNNYIVHQFFRYLGAKIVGAGGPPVHDWPKKNAGPGRVKLFFVENVERLSDFVSLICMRSL